MEAWLSLIHPADRERAQAQYLGSIETGAPFDLEYRMLARDGRRLWVHDRAVVLPDPAGRPAWIHGVIFDITQSKQAAAEREALIRELEAKNAELERFTYTVSHDLKSPLITIRGYLGFIDKAAALGDQVRLRGDIERIVGATDTMQRLLDELLELSRIGRLMNPPVTVPFGDLAREAVALVRGRLDQGGVEVTIAPNLPAVHGDRVRLVEVVQNLLDNACKFTGRQGRPRIEIGQRGQDTDGKPILFVRDNGQGIDPRYHTDIFGLFNKLDTQSAGTGIGLALVKRIIEVHGGRIWVESEGEELGSTFCFTLPRAPE